MRKPFFGICDQVVLKSACSATETSSNSDFTYKTRSVVILFCRANILLHGCAGKSMPPLLLACNKIWFSHEEAQILHCKIDCVPNIQI